MFYNPNHQFEVFSFSNVVFSSEEFGDNWTGRSSISTSVMKKASVAENNPNIMLFVRNGDLWLSTDGGYSTTSMTNNLPHGASISDVAFHPNNDSIVVMVYETYQDNNRRVYYSDDLCQTWSNISYNLSPMPANDVVLDDKGNIYVAAEIGVYTMPIDGSIWKLHGEGFPNVSFEELEIHWATNMLRGVTWGRGMWQAPLVGRSDYPRMSNIEIAQTPSMMTPSEDFPQHVTIKLDYNKKLSRMYLEWSKDSTYFNNSIDLVKLSNGDYVTETPIPSFAAGTDMYFKVFAIGADNDTTTSYKFNYTYRTCNNARNVTARASKTTICKGEGITLSALGATDYLWNEGVYASETQFPEKTRTYTVRGWSDGTCAGIDSIEVVVNSVNTGVSESELNFTAHETNASYQWLDCENNKAAIAGATQQTFTGLSAGSYAVALEKLGCKDTSACVVAPILSLNEIGEHNTVTVYPNPTSGVLLLQSEELIFHAEVLDVAGKLFFKSNENSKNVEINLEGLPKGTYLLNLKTESGSSVHKILKMESR